METMTRVNEAIPANIIPNRRPVMNYGLPQATVCPKGHAKDFARSCDDCGSEENYGYLVMKMSEPFIEDIAHVKATTWFHATQTEDWVELISKGEFAIHLGTYRTVKELTFWDERFEAGGYWLHEISVEECSVSDVVCGDMLEEWSPLEDLRGIIGTDLVRYVNAYEAPGSISLYGDPKNMKVISSKWIPEQEYI